MNHINQKDQYKCECGKKFRTKLAWMEHQKKCFIHKIDGREE